MASRQNRPAPTNWNASRQLATSLESDKPFAVSFLLIKRTISLCLLTLLGHSYARRFSIDARAVNSSNCKLRCSQGSGSSEKIVKQVDEIPSSANELYLNSSTRLHGSRWWQLLRVCLPWYRDNSHLDIIYLARSDIILNHYINEDAPLTIPSRRRNSNKQRNPFRRFYVPRRKYRWQSRARIDVITTGAKQLSRKLHTQSRTMNGTSLGS